jgi:hypothetical protein
MQQRLLKCGDNMCLFGSFDRILGLVTNWDGAGKMTGHSECRSTKARKLRAMSA